MHLSSEIFEDLECVKISGGGGYEVGTEKVRLYIIQEIIMNN